MFRIFPVAAVFDSLTTANLIEFFPRFYKKGFARHAS
jgi:hypothetical protein